MELRIKSIKWLFIILVLISLTAFSKEKDLSGFYYTKDCMYNLTLSNDYTFQFKYRIGYKKIISAGTWEIIDNKFIVLKSTYQDLQSTPVDVIENRQLEETDSLLFQITNRFVKDEKCFYTIHLNDSIQVISKDQSFKTQMYGKINNLKLYYSCPDYTGVPYPIRDTLGAVMYNVKNPMSNIYEFNWNVDDELFYYEVFNCDIIDIKNKQLYLRRYDAKLIKRK